MNKVLCKNLALILAVLLTFSTLTFFGCSGGSSIEVSLKKPEHSFYEGDNLNCYSFVKIEQGVEYEFYIQEKSKNSERVKVNGQSFRVDKVGDYTLTCEAKKGNAKGSASVDFNVKVVEPLLIHYGTVSLPLGLKAKESLLLYRFGALVFSDAQCESHLESVKVYKDFGEQFEEYQLGEDANNRYYDGSFHYLKDEGLYVYKLAVENAGGRSSKDVKVEVREDFKTITPLTDYKAEFNSQTGIITWDAIPKAEFYRVRVGSNVVTVSEGTSLDITQYIYDSIVDAVEIAAVNSDNTRFGKIVSEEDFLPAEYKGLKFSLDAKIDFNNRVATLSGPLTEGRAPSHLDKKENDYIALMNNYGVGTYIDFEFTGNNMPIVRLFANQAHGFLTHNTKDDNGGILLMSGITCNNTSGMSVHNSQLDNFRIFGDVIYNGYFSENLTDTQIQTFAPVKNEKFYNQKKQYGTIPVYNKPDYTGWYVQPHLVTYTSTQDNGIYKYLTQEGRNAEPDTKFKYTVGTYASDQDKIVINIIMYKDNAGAWDKLFEIAYDTELTLDTYDPSGIVMIAPFVGKTVSFKFSEPYTK